MAYSTSDFADGILEALGLTAMPTTILQPGVIPEENDPAEHATLALAEIRRLQQRDKDLTLLETPPASSLERVRLAARLIRTARNHLREAGANRAADYVARALKSAEGAGRHARRMSNEAQRAGA